VNQRHVTEETLEEAITRVINAYNRFALPKAWGTGQRAAADGTKWDIYEQNLLSEYHVRYGGYGGIGYYHVSDTYIALFSHFMPCGVWEAVHILDGLLQNRSDIQPDTIHGDTQAQSTTVFALAYLLGIKLMPRIRNWKDLKLFRPDKGTRYEHIDSLFSEAVDWQLIETHYPDMLRVAMSIKAGQVTAATILRRLGTYSRKNKLYFAFQELGRVIRTMFLVNYLSDAELRRTITATTNKCEAYNGFTQWVAFGGGSVIAENNRDDQRKIIKYNHLVASLVIIHSVDTMTKGLDQLESEGKEFSREALGMLSPYRTEHINRFGDYTLNLERQPKPLAFKTQLATAEM
jgi:TnpA family transposase